MLSIMSAVQQHSTGSTRSCARVAIAAAVAAGVASAVAAAVDDDKRAAHYDVTFYELPSAKLAAAASKVNAVAQTK